MSAIAPNRWFDGTEKEAANFYVGLFPDSQIDHVHRLAPIAEGPELGEALLVNFTLSGRPFTAINGGPQFQFTEAVSFSIACADQVEVDYFWNGFLAGGGEEGQCGWIKDMFGVSWQVVPTAMGEYLGGSDAAGAQRAMAAMLSMNKLDLEVLRGACEG